MSNFRKILVVSVSYALCLRCTPVNHQDDETNPEFDSLCVEFSNRQSSKGFSLVTSGSFFQEDTLLDAYSSELRSLVQYPDGENPDRLEYLERELKVRSRLLHGYYLAFASGSCTDTVYALINAELQLLSVTTDKPDIIPVHRTPLQRE